MALSPEELKQVKKEILQELISSMHQMMSDRFAPEQEEVPMEEPAPEMAQEPVEGEGMEESAESTEEESSEASQPEEMAESPEEGQSEGSVSPLDSFLSKVPPKPKEEEDDEE